MKLPKMELWERYQLYKVVRSSGTIYLNNLGGAKETCSETST